MRWDFVVTSPLDGYVGDQNRNLEKIAMQFSFPGGECEDENLEFLSSLKNPMNIREQKW